MIASLLGFSLSGLGISFEDVSDSSIPTTLLASTGGSVTLLSFFANLVEVESDSRDSSTVDRLRL